MALPLVREQAAMSIQKFTRAFLEQGEPGARKPGDGAVFDDYDVQSDSMVCAGCSCLCDDVSYYVKGGRVVRTLNLCEVAMKRLDSALAGDRLPVLPSEELRRSVEAGARIMKGHSPTLVIGADGLHEAGMVGSWELARALGGLWLPWSFVGMKRFFDGVRRWGWAGAILDEVRDRADLVMFWRADPLETHHRHLSRYSLFARGRYTERGNSDRNLAAVAAGDTVMERLCQQFFRMAPSEDLGLIQALTGPNPAPASAHRDFVSLVKALERSLYIALFVDPEKVTADAMQGILEWAAAVNAGGHRRMAVLPLWGGGVNASGFVQLSLERNASGCGADFSEGGMGAVPEGDWEDIAIRVGSVLMFESGPDGAQRRRLPGPLLGKPLVLVTPFKRPSLDQAQVVIPTALAGIEQDGVFFRADGLPLTAHAVPGLACDGYPTVEEVISGLLREVLA